MSLRARLAIAAAVILLAVGAAGWFLPRTVRASQIDQIDRQLRGVVPIGSLLVTDFPVSPNETPRPPSGSALSDAYVARIHEGARTVVARPQSSSNREPATPSGSTAAGSDPSAATVGSTGGGGTWRAVLLDLPNGDQLLVAIPLDRVDATTRTALVTVTAAGAAVLVTMVATGWWLLRLGLDPIAEVTAVAAAIARGERSRRVREPASGTEAAHLAHAFNVMLDEQQATEARLRQFIADASHELRTPLAAVGGFADLWRTDGLDGRQVDDVMRRIGQETSRMRGLVEDLLLLARLDEGLPLVHEPVDLVRLVNDAVLDASATHPSRRIVVDAPGNAFVVGDENRLRQVVANLLTNALTHGGPTATVAVRIVRGDDATDLVVADGGVGMSSDDTAHAFDRLWRADAARARSGSGLGLAIVRSIVDALQGDVTLTSTLGQGTSVRVRLLSVDAAGNPQTTVRSSEG